jgi:hypothetical protein
MSKQRREQPHHGHGAEPLTIKPTVFGGGELALLPGGETAEGVEPGPFGSRSCGSPGAELRTPAPCGPRWTARPASTPRSMAQAGGTGAGAVLHQRRWPPGRAGPRAGQAASTAPCRASAASKSLASWPAAADTALAYSRRTRRSCSFRARSGGRSPAGSHRPGIAAEPWKCLSANGSARGVDMALPRQQRPARRRARLCGPAFTRSSGAGRPVPVSGLAGRRDARQRSG